MAQTTGAVSSMSAVGASPRAVLVLAPKKREAKLVAQVLQREKIPVEICRNLLDLSRRFGPSIEALLIAEEALLPSELPLLLDALAQQPPWSDMPVTVLTSAAGAEEAGARVLEIFGPKANVGLLERPIRAATLISTFQVALRARRRQREMHDLLEQRESALTSISDAFAALDGEWRYVYVNDRAAEFAQLRREEMIGRSIWEIYPDAVGGNFHKHALRARDTKQPQTFEQYYERWECWLETHIYPAGDGVVVFRANINERKLAEETLREKEAFVRLLLDSAADAFYGVDREGVTTICNAAFLRMLGFDREDEVIGRKLHDVIHHSHPDGSHYAKEDCYIYQTAQTGRPAHIDNELFFRRDGTGFPVEYWSYPIIRDGELRGAVTTFVDVTERRQAEEVIRAREAQLRFVTDHAATILLAHCDPRERFLFVNASYAARYGKSPAELIGKTVHDTIGHNAYAVMQETLKKALAGNRVEVEMEVPYDSGPRWMSYTFVPELTAAGEVMSFVAVIQDVTERKNIELVLQQAKQQAEDANRAKDQFLAMLSHELRTPLTPVLMTIASMQHAPDISDEIRTDLETLRRNVELEVLLIDDLLDLTRIAHGKLELHAAATDVHAAITDALLISAADVEAKNLHVDLSLRATEHHCWADGARLQQVFWNLVKNAVKFTEPGGRLEIATRNDASHSISIEFTDNGIGIAPELQARIFDAFEQGGENVTRLYGGLGLGLAISKRVVDMHHGKIEVWSEGVGRGSRFTVTLQAMETSLLEGPSYPNAHEVLKDYRGKILLVEDHADTARILCRMLEISGYRVVHTKSIANARTLAAKGTFDLMISDLALPDGSGLDLMREVAHKQNLRGIALSGFGMENDVEASRAAGFSEHFTKPVDWERLREGIERTMPRASTKTPVGS